MELVAVRYNVIAVIRPNPQRGNRRAGVLLHFLEPSIVPRIQELGITVHSKKNVAAASESYLCLVLQLAFRQFLQLSKRRSLGLQLC